MSLLVRAVEVTALGLLMSLMFGCASSSSLAGIWHDPSYQALPLGKMLVIAVRKDAVKRRMWEDAFTGELAKHGATATSSYSLFPDAPPDTNQIITTVQANGFDGFLVILRLPTERNTNVVQGYTTTERDTRNGQYSSPYYDPYYGSYWQRYNTYFREIDHPGYVDSQTVAIRSIEVTTTGNGGHLIWSATSRTPDPGSASEVQRGIAGLVLSALAKRNIIGSGK
jgi:hypothetical protein